MKLLLLAMVLLSLSCTKHKAINKIKDAEVSDSVFNKSKDQLQASAFHVLQKLFAAGDFDGDDKVDTVRQHTFSKLTNTEIDSSINPFINGWDSTIAWFYKQDADVYLSLNKEKSDILHLGQVRDYTA